MKLKFLFAAIVLFTVVSNAQINFPLQVSADKRHLVDQKNKPVPILGRTAWFILSQPEAGYKKFLDNSLTYGYNAIEFAAIMHWPIGNHAPFNGLNDMPFLRRLDGKEWSGELKYDSQKEMPDFSTPNEKYWRHVDRLLKYCEQQGVMTFMFPAYLGYDGQEQGWMKELVANGPEKIEGYGAWIASRYKNRKNIVWMLLGDFGNLNKEQLVAERALIKGLKSIKGQSIQFTAESHSGENAADNIDVGREMTLNAVYTWELKNPVPHVARKGYAHSPTMPAFLLEEPYDEEGPDGNNYNINATQPVRRFQWWGWMSTTAGYISGNGYVWQFIDPVWKDHLDTRGTKDMGRLNSFIKDMPWWKLVPSGLDGTKDIVVSYNSDTTATYISASVAKDGSLLVAYVPPAYSSNEFTLDLSQMKAEIYGYWFDPTNGKYIAIQSKITGDFQLPGNNSTGERDWVLLLTTVKR